MNVSFCFYGWGGGGDDKLWQKAAGARKRGGSSRDEMLWTERDTMIQLPSNFSLPLWPALLQSLGRNVAQIRASACWGGCETGKQREGKEKQESNHSQFTQAEGFSVHLCVPDSPLHSLDPSDWEQSHSVDTKTLERPHIYK